MKLRGCHSRNTPASWGFTLVELLVVVVIIGILATIAAPSFKGLGQANTAAAANSLVLGDLAYARLKAINERTTVFMVFVPPTLRSLALNNLNDAQRRQFTNVVTGQYTAYALFTRRGVGAQPGAYEPRYLTEWKYLPDGQLFATNKYDFTRVRPAYALTQNLPLASVSFPRANFPFPTARSPLFALPYVAFNSLGRLVEYDAQMSLVEKREDLVFGLARGSILYARNATGQILPAQGPDVVVTPPSSLTNNLIRISWLTGRARAVPVSELNR